MSTYWLHGRGIAIPVKVNVENPHAGLWVADEPETGIWGEGCSEAGAIEDLRLALNDHRDVLKSCTALSAHLSFQRRWLDAHLAPKAPAILS